MSERSPYRRWYLSEGAREGAPLSASHMEFLEDLPAVLNDEEEQDLVVATAAEVLSRPEDLPDWIGTETRYLIIGNIPEPAILRLPTLLGLHKPDRRMHVTRDGRAVKRMVIALARDRPWEGIVDAYILEDRIVTVLGDFRMPEFPRERLPVLASVEGSLLERFSLDPSGSYLFWEELDLHLGPSQLFQAVDPMYLADVEIRRYAAAKVSLALLQLREETGLRQSDIGELSERHVRRLEKEEARLTVAAAESYAAAFGVSLDDFLAMLSGKISKLRDRAELKKDEWELERNTNVYA